MASMKLHAINPWFESMTTSSTFPWLSQNDPSLLSSSSIIAAIQESSTAATTTNFEPVLNVPALISFVIIMTLALLLRLRVGAIEEAAERRKLALNELREIKSQQLAADIYNITDIQVQNAILAYEQALKEEESIRTIFPGARLRAPNLPNEQDVQAIRQFLSTSPEDADENSVKKSILVRNENNEVEEEGDSSNIPPLGLATLWLFIFGSQIMLLVFLSMDDTVMTDLFNSISTGSSSSSNIVPGGDNFGDVSSAMGDLVSME